MSAPLKPPTASPESPGPQLSMSSGDNRNVGTGGITMQSECSGLWLMIQRATGFESWKHCRGFPASPLTFR